MNSALATFLIRRHIQPARRKPVRRPRLGLELLENRLAPAVQTFGGLDFTAAAFSVNGTQVSASSQVSVAVTGESTQLLDFSGGISFQSNDPSGSLTPLGSVSAVVPGQADVPLLNSSTQ